MKCVWNASSIHENTLILEHVLELGKNRNRFDVLLCVLDFSMLRTIFEIILIRTSM